MLNQLKADLGVEKSVSIGSADGQADVVFSRNDSNTVVHRLERMYEPFFWERL